MGALSDNVKNVIAGMAGPIPVLNAKNDVDMGDIVIVSEDPIEDPEAAKLRQELQVPPPSVTVVWARAVIQLNVKPSAKTRKPTSIFRIVISPGRTDNRLRAPGWGHGKEHLAHDGCSNPTSIHILTMVSTFGNSLHGCDQTP
jgi:hypothetical protein